MKKLLTFALAFLLAPSAFGQSVGASQIKKRAAGGLVADSANALTVAVYRATTAPASPVTGQLWCDTTTTPCSMKTYSGSAWTSPPNTAVMTQPTLATLPANPTDGQIVWVSSQGRAIVYVGSEAKWYYLDSTGRTAQADYSIDVAGYSTAFLSSPGATTGALASGGSMTAGAHSCAVTHYSATGGETLPGGALTLTTGGANNTITLVFAATGANVAGKRVYCSKAGTTTPLFLVASIDDTTTGTYNVTVADGSFLAPAAPDKDFSAPLPAGWVFYAPDRSHGGCGSTGTTLLCSLTKVISNTSSATSSGVRLFYPITGDPAAWRASWRITRITNGFPGATASVGGLGPVATVSTDAAAVAPVMATVFSFKENNGAVFPWSATWEPAFHVTRRTENAGWANYTSAHNLNFPPISTPSAHMLVRGIKDGSEYSLLFATSPNGVDFAGVYFGDDGKGSVTGDYRPCTTASWCGTVKPSHVGIGIESLQNSANTLTGMIYELDSFRWASE